jgi:PleD family two-component response regulator
MNKNFDKKLSALDPRFRKKIHDLLDSMHESVSMLYEAATHDEKTGLYNNKFFETILEMEIEKAKRGKEDLSLIMVDIDFFKKIND